MRLALTVSLLLSTVLSARAEVPELDSFRIVPQYPSPAAGADLTLGAADGNGRLVFWNGDTVYHQEEDEDTSDNELTGNLIPSGAGYLGNPSFVEIEDNGRTVWLGSGEDGIMYIIEDIRDALDFVPGDEIAIPTHFSGELLSNRLLLLDRTRDDLSGAEIVLVDLSTDPVTAFAVLQKPAGSAPAALTLSPAGNVYVMNPTTRELRYFDEAAIRNAYETATPLDWTSDGLPLGAAGQFLNGGVYGVSADSELIIGGDENAAGTGGIQWVDPNSTPPAILGTLDPAGSGPPYVLIVSRELDKVIAIDPTTSPPNAWASTEIVPAIPPDSPCDDFEAIQQEFTAFVEQFSPEATDLDSDAVRDTAMLALVGIYACQVNEDVPLAFSTNTAYDDNREVFATETNAAALEDYNRIIPILLFMNSSMQSATLNLLSTAGTGLTGSYTTVTCTDVENCLPEFVEDPVTRGPVPPYEPYFSTGDADGDGVSNLDEYNNVLDMGGDDNDFAVAAASDDIDGSGGIDTGSSGGGCFIATAAYGTPMAAELDGLRAFRDHAMLGNPFGAAFADTYYRLSPPVAAWLAPRPALRAATRVVLLPFVDRTATIAVVLCLASAAMAFAIRRNITGAVQRK